MYRRVVVNLCPNALRVQLRLDFIAAAVLDADGEEMPGLMSLNDRETQDLNGYTPIPEPLSVFPRK